MALRFAAMMAAAAVIVLAAAAAAAAVVLYEDVYTSYDVQTAAAAVSYGIPPHFSIGPPFSCLEPKWAHLTPYRSVMTILLSTHICYN